MDDRRRTTGSIVPSLVGDVAGVSRPSSFVWGPSGCSGLFFSTIPFAGKTVSISSLSSRIFQAGFDLIGHFALDARGDDIGVTLQEAFYRPAVAWKERSQCP